MSNSNFFLSVSPVALSTPLGHAEIFANCFESSLGRSLTNYPKAFQSAESLDGFSFVTASHPAENALNAF